ncbi:MAG: AAA family ATPase [Candidatus Obscuribacterales bacterium]|nr:AAA family ATPase [Candidatus Obscuribacterales bacterium]
MNFPTVQDLEESIRSEIKAVKRDQSKFLNVSEGVQIAPTEEGFLYSFKCDSKVFIPAESPILFQQQKTLSVAGTWISQSDFDILIVLSSDLGKTIKRAKVSVDLTYILQALIARLNEQTDDSQARGTLLNSKGRILFDQENYRKSLISLNKLKLSRNESQSEAILQCLRSEFHCVWGPPGTGKTANLAQLCRVLSDQGEKSIIVSHANAAVDVAAVKIAQAHENSALLSSGRILRIGISQLKEARNQKHISALSALRKHFPEIVNAFETLETEKEQLTSEIAKGHASTQLHKRLKEVRLELAKVRAKVKDAETVLIKQASILVATTSKLIIDDRLWTFNPENIIIDETSMLGFPFVFANAKKASRRLLLFGDFRQLPPVCISDEPKAVEWLGRDAFDVVGIQSAIDSGRADKRITLLNTQYRMHKKIGELVSQLSYDGQLKTGSNVTESVQSIANGFPSPGNPIVLLDTAELKTACITEGKPGSFSRLNPLHALIVMELALAIVERGTHSLAVISPYRAQAKLLQMLAAAFGIAKSVSVATIHRFQGSEIDTVILDLADAPPQTKASMLTGSDAEMSKRLLNVAISRARGKLVIVADFSFIDAFHPGRSAARKLHQSLKEIPKELARSLLTDSKTNSGLTDWASAQVPVHNLISMCSTLETNIPAGFRPSNQLKRKLGELESQTTGEKKRSLSDQFLWVKTDRQLILGGCADTSPLVVLSGDFKDCIENAIITSEF